MANPFADPITLPTNLTELAVTRFDELHASGKLNYGPSSHFILKCHRFVFQFSIPPALAQKPILSPDDPRRQQPGGPFLNPDPDFVLCDVGPKHILELNKHCILRPMYVLHTRDYEKQSDHLNLQDFEATWALMQHVDAELPKHESLMAIFNCGAEAGASQGHKHLQLLRRPRTTEFELFPYQLELFHGQSSSHPNVPYEHTIRPISHSATAEGVFSLYDTLMKEIAPLVIKRRMRAEADPYISNEYPEDENFPHNVIIVKHWILIIPREAHGKDGVECNALGMMGMVWLRDEEEYKGWKKLGFTEHLRWLGVARRLNYGGNYGGEE